MKVQQFILWISALPYFSRSLWIAVKTCRLLQPWLHASFPLSWCWSGHWVRVSLNTWNQMWGPGQRSRAPASAQCLSSYQTGAGDAHLSPRYAKRKCQNWRWLWPVITHTHTLALSIPTNLFLTSSKKTASDMQHHCQTCLLLRFCLHFVQRSIHFVQRSIKNITFYSPSCQNGQPSCLCPHHKGTAPPPINT